MTSVPALSWLPSPDTKEQNYPVRDLVSGFSWILDNILQCVRQLILVSTFPLSPVLSATHPTSRFCDETDIVIILVSLAEELEG
ncbi:hypothetical protein NC651_027800 [Populus alba x Populus x berolinensis]|nr:hypothetical protein NC651_027800 [Populus alba x Populus x berolinensis]